MADRIKDAEDQMLEALFRAEPIVDDGFSDRVVGKIKRRLWIRRITLPIAAAVGAVVSLKPLGALITALFGFVNTLPADVVSVPTGWVPPLPMLVLGGMLFAALMFGLRLLEE